MVNGEWGTAGGDAGDGWICGLEGDDVFLTLNVQRPTSNIQWRRRGMHGMGGNGNAGLHPAKAPVSTGVCDYAG